MSCGVPTKRLVELDSLRGLAALSVLWFHYTTVVKRFVPNVQLPDFAFRYGHFGVELFFIISGYVIFMTLNRCRSHKDFIVSRTSRLLPTFWTSMTITFVVGIYFPLQGQSYDILQYVVNLTMLQEYVKVNDVDPVYWSLTYEIGFYFAMYGLYRMKALNHIEWICFLWIAGAALFHWYSPYIPHPMHYLLVLNAYGHLFAGGIILYRIHHHGYTPLRMGLLLSVPLVQWEQEGGMAGLIVAGLVIVFVLAMHDRLAILRWRVLVFLGTISYALYVLHHLLGFRVIQFLQSNGVQGTSSLLLTSIGLVMLSTFVTYGVERPAQRLARILRKREESKLKET